MCSVPFGAYKIAYTARAWIHMTARLENLVVPLLFFLWNAGEANSCGAGMYSVTTDGDCYSCMHGTYASGAGSTRCTECPVGQFTNRSGAEACTPCHPGSFQYAQGGSECLACPAGKAQDSSGATACFSCAAGLVQPVPGSSTCRE